MVELQSTNRVKISKVREATFGVIPTAPAFKTRRVTSHGLATNPQTTVSNEIRADRQVSDLILVATQAGGQSGGELSFKTMDEDFEEALQKAWSLTPERDNAGTADSVITNVATTGTIVTCTTGPAFVAGQLVLFSGFAIAGNNGRFKCTTGSATVPAFVGSGITDETVPPAAARLKVVGFIGASGDIAATTTGLTSSSLDFTTLGLVPGQFLCLAGFATGADNDFVRIVSVAAHVIVLDRLPVGWAADAGTAVIITAYFGDVLTNGSTKWSNTFERQYLDHSPVTYEYLKGQELDKLALSINAAAVVTFTEDWMGSDGTVTTTRAASATDTAAPTNDVLNAATNVGRIGFNGSAIIGPNFVQAATVEFANNLRRQVAIGSLAAVGIGNGEFTVSGTMNTYFGDKTELDKLLANTLTSFDFRIGRTDSNNESYLFDFPSIKLKSGSPSVSGKNADVMLNVGWQAIMDATLGYTAMIERFWYLP